MTAEQTRSFALTCGKTGVVPVAVVLLRGESSAQLKQTIVHFLHALSGRHGVPFEIARAGVSPSALASHSSKTFPAEAHL